MTLGALMAAVLLLAPVGPLAISDSLDSCPEEALLTSMSSVRCRVGGGLWGSMQTSTTWRYRIDIQVCKDDGDPGLCYNPDACQSDDGQMGTWYWVVRAEAGTNDWERTEWLYCSAGGDDQKVTITSQMAFNAMRSLAWPSAELVIQPPNGKTLVNFPTNFYTTLSVEAQMQDVKIAKRDVEIEATPTSFTWHWAAAGETADPADEVPSTTTTPGGPVVQGQDPIVAHEYTDADVTVHPWVDVTYSGRYRVDGGEWQDIEDTLTVGGAPVDLTVVEARLRLVG